jgi:hypothetical protein
VQYPRYRGGTAQQVRQQPLKFAPVIGINRRECCGTVERLRLESPVVR